MDEIVKQVSQKTGISDQQAQQAVETVMRFLRERLPKPIADQVQKALEGGEIPDVGDAGKQLGGLLGKKQPSPVLQPVIPTKTGAGALPAGSGFRYASRPAPRRQARHWLDC